jgi:hypothetical protein
MKMKNNITFVFCLFVSLNLISQTTNQLIKPKCIVKDLSADDNYGPINTTSIYGDFKTVLSLEKCSSGGQYSGFSFEMFKKQNGKYVAIENKLMFKENQNELLQIINNLLKQKFENLSKDSELGICYPKTLPFIYLNDLGMTFCNETISFYAPFEINEDCQCATSIEPISVEMSLSELETYIIK